MPEYTFSPAVVLVQETGKLAIGATGVLRDDNGDALQVYDLNGSPLPGIVVGSQGATPYFKADVPSGNLDFGSALIPSVSIEAIVAALTAVGIANDALNAALTSGGRTVFAGDDANTPRPSIDGPLLWLCSATPVNADPATDYWMPLGGTATPGTGGGTGGVTTSPDPDIPGAFIISGGILADPDIPGAYII